MSWIGYYIFYILVACFGLCGYDAAIAFGFLSPWIIILLIVLYLPLVSVCARGIKLSVEAKRNHLLEHGTIVCLEKAYKLRRGIGGKAENKGFRIYGKIENKRDIETAFTVFIEKFRMNDYECAFSPRCGSTAIVVQGFGLLLLFISSILFPLVKFNLLIVIGILVLNIFAFIFIRKPLASIFQRNFVMAMDFKYARIASINKVSKKIGERSPVYFVQTAIEF